MRGSRAKGGRGEGDNGDHSFDMLWIEVSNHSSVITQDIILMNSWQCRQWVKSNEDSWYKQKIYFCHKSFQKISDPCRESFIFVSREILLFSKPLKAAFAINEKDTYSFKQIWNIFSDSCKINIFYVKTECVIFTDLNKLQISMRTFQIEIYIFLNILS